MRGYQSLDVYEETGRRVCSRKVSECQGLRQLLWLKGPQGEGQCDKQGFLLSVAGERTLFGHLLYE